MQLPTTQIVPPRVRAAAVVIGAVGIAGLAVSAGAGCTSAPPAPQASGKPFAGVAVSVACPDPAFARELTHRCAAWAARTGAVAQVHEKPPADAPDADVAVIRPPEIGSLAARGELVSVPAPLRAPTHPLQWGGIAAMYRSVIPGWAGEPLGLPLAGDGYVLAYRADRLTEKGTAPPATWEAVAEVAARFHAADGRPSLPTLPADRHRLLAEFHHIAACYDRKVRFDADKFVKESGEAGLSLHFRPDTWEPRLNAPAFAEAADWLHRTREYRSGDGDDPVRALTDGTAVLAVLSLAEVGRLPQEGGEVSRKYGIAPLPGTQSYFDAAGKPTRAGPAGNFVPFLGFGGQVGVVFKRSRNADAAWDLLAELALPASGTALISNPALGAGPYRVGHTDPGAWYGYRFDENRTRDLAAAVGQYLGVNVVNPVLALRTPDQAELLAALEVEVRRAAAGEATGKEAMQRAAEAWAKLDAGKNRDELNRWRRNAIGLP